MAIESDDRLHAKQGRSTCRVRFDAPGRPAGRLPEAALPAPWSTRLAALLDPAGRHSPAGAEWRHLRRARDLGRPGPRGRRRRRAARPLGAAPELPDGRGADRLPPAPRGDPAAGRDASTRRRSPAGSGGLIAGMADLIVAAPRGRLLPQGPVPLPLLRRPRPTPRPGSTLIDLHRLASHRGRRPGGGGRTSGSSSSRRSASPASTTATGSASGARYRRRMGLRWPGLDRRLDRASRRPATSTTTARPRPCERPGGPDPMHLALNFAASTRRRAGPRPMSPTSAAGSSARATGSTSTPPPGPRGPCRRRSAPSGSPRRPDPAGAASSTSPGTREAALQGVVATTARSGSSTPGTTT